MEWISASSSSLAKLVDYARLSHSAYHILCHANLDKVGVQFYVLYATEEVFLIDVDDGKSPNIEPIRHWLWLARSNVHLRQDAQIG